MAPRARAAAAPRRRERRSSRAEGRGTIGGRAAPRRQRPTPRPSRPNAKRSGCTRRARPATRRSSSTKPAACSAAPRSPRRTRATAREARARAAASAPPAPEQAEKPAAAEAPPPSARPAPLRPPQPAPPRAGAEPRRFRRPPRRLRRRPPRQRRRRRRQVRRPKRRRRAPNPEAEVTELLARYKAALEARDLDALKRIWPGLCGNAAGRDPRRVPAREPASASRSSIRGSSCHGDTGTVSFVRRLRGRHDRRPTAPQRDANDDGDSAHRERLGHRADPLRARTMNARTFLEIALLAERTDTCEELPWRCASCWLLCRRFRQPHKTASRVARDAVRGRLRPERPGAEQRRRPARWHHARGALQQRVPVGFPAGQHRADQPAHGRSAAIAGLRLHLQVRFRNRHVRALDEQLRSDPLRSRRDHRPRPPRVRVLTPVLLLRSSRRRVAHRHARGVPARRLRNRRRPRRRRLDDEHHRGDGQPVHGRVDLRHHRSRRRVAGRSDRQDAPVAALERARSTGSERVPTSRSTTSGTIWRSADTDQRTSTSSKDRRAASAIWSCG